MSTKSPKYTKVITLRLTQDEWRKVQGYASKAGLTPSAYIRLALFNEEPAKIHTRGKHPVKDHVALAKAQALLGASPDTAIILETSRSQSAGLIQLTPEFLSALKTSMRRIDLATDYNFQALGVEVPPSDDH